VGIFKAYQTRVGAGPMPTELDDETGEKIRTVAKEFGTVSGRPRRCGWFDAVAARLSARVNGFTEMAVTRLDVLDTLPEIRICTAYEIDGRTTKDFPAGVSVLEKCKPVCESWPGWEAPTSDARKFEDLPENARRYVERLEELVGCKTSLISIGERRDQTIVRKPVF
jgi:adenylosuccinate synthase